jgi:YcaO-like protein with predicted kinase domain
VTSAKGHIIGTHRIVPPETTLARMRPLMRPLGITRIANITGLDIIGIPVVVVCRPNARSLAVSQGKGVDLEAAKASGLMESIELFHAEHMINPLHLHTLRELNPKNVVDTSRLPRSSISTFHPARRILWVSGTNLVDGRTMFVPHEMVHQDCTLPLPQGSGCFVMSSNGLASGNDPDEAILHGACEVIERDATTLWAYASLREQEQRHVDLATIDDPLCREVLNKYERTGIAVGVWDTTTDLGVPAFACVIADRERHRLHMLYPTHGMGCHTTPEIALLRALTEAAQGRLTFISGARDDSGHEKYRLAQSEQHHSMALKKIDAPAPRSFREAPCLGTESVAGDRAAVVARLAEHGFSEVVAVDLTHPALGVPVFRVIVPGLEALYEVQKYLPGERASRVLQRPAEHAS